jgi:hypothetical protein
LGIWGSARRAVATDTGLRRLSAAPIPRQSWRAKPVLAHGLPTAPGGAHIPNPMCPRMRVEAALYGQLTCVHLDANVAPPVPAIARSTIDNSRRSYAPAPGSNQSLAGARAARPDKVLWTRFPSAVFQAPDIVFEERARRFLADVAPGDRFLISITEDVPSHRVQDGMRAIACALRVAGYNRAQGESEPRRGLSRRASRRPSLKMGIRSQVELRAVPFAREFERLVERGRLG